MTVATINFYRLWPHCNRS